MTIHSKPTGWPTDPLASLDRFLDAIAVPVQVFVVVFAVTSGVLAMLYLAALKSGIFG